jgi:hypothetical protein
MQLRLFLLLAACCFALEAQMALTAGQIEEMVRSSLALKEDDGKIAKFLKGVKLSGKLDDKTVQDLEAQGAGPKTSKVLEQLRDKTAALKGPAQNSGPSQPSLSMTPVAKPAYKQPPPPDSIHQKQILDQMRSYAVSYISSLPNFLCVQSTTRYASFDGGDRYRLMDRVLAKLSYNNGHEDYKVYSVNNQLVDTTMDKLGGAVSTGEFGSLLKSVFDRKSEAEFGWDHWATLRGKRMAVFNYSIDSGNSDFSLDFDHGAQRIVTSYKGLVYADQNTGVITRVTFNAVNIPAGFPIRKATTRLDYDDVKINDISYLVPLASTTWMIGPNNVYTRNEEVFRLYQKFGTNSDIKYSDVDTSLPADQTTEQPAEQADPAMKGLPPPPPK